MKQKIYVIFLAAVILFAACKPQLEPPENFKGNPEDIGIEIDLLRLTLDKTEIAIISGRSLPALNVTKYPPNATRAELVWTSTNEPIAAVDGTGALTITSVTVPEPQNAVIRVSAKNDPSVYAECVITVYPNYPANRHLQFERINGVSISSEATFKTEYAKLPKDTKGDVDMGDGIFLMHGTGGAPGGDDGYSVDPTKERNKAYPIDPEHPYAFGMVPNGGARGLGTGTQWSAGRSEFTGFSNARLHTGGRGRHVKIAAIFRPFKITVNYRSNSNNSGRWADIRIGETEGLWLQGAISNPTTAGNGQATINFVYNLDENGDPREDFVPLIFVESNEAIQIFDVIITPN